MTTIPTPPPAPSPSTLRTHRFRVTAPDDPRRGQYGSSLGGIYPGGEVILGFGPTFDLAVYSTDDVARGCGCAYAGHDTDCPRPVWACPLCDRSDEIELTVTRVITATPQAMWKNELVVDHITVDKDQDQARRLHCRACEHTYDVPEGLRLIGM